MLQLRKVKLHRYEMLSDLKSSLLLPFKVTKPVTSREMSIPLGARDTKLDSRKGINKT